MKKFILILAFNGLGPLFLISQGDNTGDDEKLSDWKGDKEKGSPTESSENQFISNDRTESTVSSEEFLKCSSLDSKNSDVDVEILPSLGLIDYKAIADKNGIELSWSTTFESYSDYFIIERSNDGINFDFVDIVPAAGFSETKKHYRLIDTLPAWKENYYQLKKVQFDGSVESLGIVFANIKIPEGVEIAISPNRLETFNLRIQSSDKSQVQVNLVDILGNQRYSYSMGNGLHSIDRSKLSGGIYVLTYQMGSHTNTERLILRL